MKGMGLWLWAVRGYQVEGVSCRGGRGVGVAAVNTEEPQAGPGWASGLRRGEQGCRTGPEQMLSGRCGGWGVGSGRDAHMGGFGKDRISPWVPRHLQASRSGNRGPTGGEAGPQSRGSQTFTEEAAVSGVPQA